jgi:hypothetical protein
VTGGDGESRGYASKREDEALQLLAVHLGGQIVDRPEENSTAFPGLFTDGVLRNSVGRLWAVDVTVLAEDPGIANSASAAHQHFDPVARDNGLLVQLVVEAGIPLKPLASRLKSKIPTQAESGQMEGRGWSMEWRRAAKGELIVHVVAKGTLLASTVDTRSIPQRMRDTLLPVLEKKKRQQRRAQDRGLPYGLVVDCDGHPGIAQGVPWISARVESRQYAIWGAWVQTRSHLDGVLMLYRGILTPVVGRYGDTHFDLPKIE